MSNLQEEYEIARRMDAIAAMCGVLSDPAWPTYYDELRTLAVHALAAERAGCLVTQTWLVVPSTDEEGWTYVARDPDGMMPGCLHEGAGGNRELSQADAIEAHRAERGCRVVRAAAHAKDGV